LTEAQGTDGAGDPSILFAMATLRDIAGRA
jgi:hypothetical protein